jgi:hypothetical protein
VAEAGANPELTNTLPNRALVDLTWRAYLN